MREDRAADNRQIGIGAEKVVRKPGDEIELLDERTAVDFHRCMLAGQHNAVLVVIHVGRVLQKPLLSVQRQRNEPVRCPCRLGQTARKALVLSAERALRISGLLLRFRRGNRLGVLLRLGEVDRNVQCAVFPVVNPLEIPLHAVGADIIRCAGEVVVIVGRGFWRLRIAAVEFINHPAGKRRQKPHQLGIEQIPPGHAVVGNDPLLHGVIARVRQNLLQGALRRLPGALKRADVQLFHQPVLKIYTVAGICKPAFFGIGDQIAYHLAYRLLHSCLRSNPIAGNYSPTFYIIPCFSAFVNAFSLLFQRKNRQRDCNGERLYQTGGDVTKSRYAKSPPGTPAER